MKLVQPTLLRPAGAGFPQWGPVCPHVLCAHTSLTSAPVHCVEFEWHGSQVQVHSDSTQCRNKLEFFSPQHVESIRSLCPVKSVCWGIAGRGTTTNRRLAPSPSSSKAMLKISRLRMVSWTLPTVNLSSPRPSCAVRSKGIRKSRLQARPYGRAHSVPLLPGDTHPRHRCMSHSHV